MKLRASDESTMPFVAATNVWPNRVPAGSGYPVDPPADPDLTGMEFDSYHSTHPMNTVQVGYEMTGGASISSTRVLMPGYVSPSLPSGGGKLTGGILYDYMVAQAFRDHGWEVMLFDLETLPRYAKMLKFPAPRLVAGSCGRDHDVLVTDLGNSPLVSGLQHGTPMDSGRLDVLICHHFRAHLERTLPRRLIYGHAERRIVAGADLLIANSPYTESILLKMGRNRDDIVLAPPGLNVPVATNLRFRETPADVLMVGGIEPRKGVVDAILALEASGLENLRLTVAGDAGRESRYLEQVRHCIEEKGLASRVRLVGRLDDRSLLKAYAGADAFMLLSHWEGYGMAIAEAMASGLPVISTTAGAIPDLVEDGVSGLLVDPGDWQSAGDSLRRLFTDGELRRSLSKGALHRAAGLPTWEETTGRILEAVAERLSGRS